MTKAYIKDIVYYLPDNVISNEEIVADFPEWSVKKIADKVGVKNRCVAAPKQTATDLAIKAATDLFAKGLVNIVDIDFILLCTQSPDFKLPSSSCIIQDKLGIAHRCGALDFNLGCSGYEYGLALAKGLLVSGIASNVLLLTAETYTKYLHAKDKANKTIFGDGASATVISTEGFAEICEFELGTDGSGAENLMVKTGGAKFPKPMNDLRFDENGNPISSDHLFMNGSEVFLFTLSVVPKMVNDVLAKNSLMKDQVDLFIFHQANSYMLDHLRRKLKIDENKFFVNLAEIGNTVSSTIPIAICDAKKKGVLKGNVLIAGFGVGFSWGGVILKC